MSFETKDSGERVQFDSGMVRDVNTGKTLWHLVTSGPMLRRWAELLTRGAEKYTPNNWMLASGQTERDRFRESAFRHFMQWYNGETDEDHAAAVFFNINGSEYIDARTAEESGREVGGPGETDRGGEAGSDSSYGADALATALARGDRGRNCAVCDAGGLHRLEERTNREDGYTPFDPDLYGGRWYESSLD